MPKHWPMPDDSPLWAEYDSAAEWCAKRHSLGREGDPLPDGLSAAVAQEISEHPDDFERRVRQFAYAIAMEKHGFPDA